MVARPIVYTAICERYALHRDDVKCFRGDGIFQRPVLEAKRYKVLPHLFFDAEITIWVDGNVWLRAPADEAVERFLGDRDIAAFAHPYRHTVWEEFAALREQKRFQIPWLQQQLAAQELAYRAAGLPSDVPLYECNFLIRRNCERVNRLMDAWWAEICRWQWRDQVSLPYVLWKHGAELKLRPIIGNIRDHPDFRHVEQW